MKPPSAALLRAFSPFWRPQPSPLTTSACLKPRQTQSTPFSSTASLQKRKKRGPRPDNRITAIRYFLGHPLTPRPLRFSRTRYLRHWTIQRAWNLHREKLRRERQVQLEQQYRSMYNACEALRLIDGDGLTAKERQDLGVVDSQKDVLPEGRLYRIAMQKKGIWDGVPIEYAKIQTDSPARDGWNHAWTR